MKVPNLFLIGAQKAGTTYIHDVLVKNKLVSTGIEKEMNFFSKPETVIKRNTNKYLMNFTDSSKNKYLIDASTSHFQPNDPSLSKNAAKQIYNFNKNAKIIAVIRNPVERYQSAYNHHILGGKLNYINEIDEILDQYLMLDIGKYDESIIQWKNYFPQIKILIYDNLILSKELFFKEILDFLGLNVNPEELKLNFRTNDTSKRYAKNLPGKLKAQLTKKARNHLKDYFQESIMNTEKLINQDLSHWLK